MERGRAEQGVCPSCGGVGVPGSTCPERVCARRGYHHLPRELLGAAPAGADAWIGRSVGDYVLCAPLGQGGFGRVYLALQLPLLMKTAVKVLLRDASDSPWAPESLTRLRGEAEALATLSHPNIVRLMMYGVHEDTPYLVMEYVEGGRTLRDELLERSRRGVRLSSQEGRQILWQVLAALEAAHVRGVIHRDVKPDNVMLQPVAGHGLFVKVVDFGLAKLVADGSMNSRALGTPAYMAPEQLSDRRIGPWTDVYAAGLLAFELLTGQRLFQGSTEEIVVRKLNPAHLPLDALGGARLPEGVARVIERALSFEAQARWPDAASFRDALDEASTAVSAGRALTSPDAGATILFDSGQARGSGAAPRGSQGGSPPPRRSTRVVLGGGIVGGVVALALAAGLASHWWSVEQPPDQFATGSEPAPRTVATGHDLGPPAPRPPIIRVGATSGERRERRSLDSGERPTPAGMVAVDGGSYVIGCTATASRCWPDERPAHEVRLRRFALDRVEVSVAAYTRCVDEGICSPPKGAPGCAKGDDGTDVPMTCISWHDAVTFCRHRRARLPTEEEWEAAARGPAGASWPWGDGPPDCGRAVLAAEAGPGCGTRRLQAVGARAADRSWAGVLDLGGSVREWTSSAYGAYPGGTTDARSRGKVTRGASWVMQPEEAGTSHTRGVDPPETVQRDLGFRCAVDL